MATNIINGKSYIGQTVRSLNLRINSHISEAMTNHDNMYFHRALKKYGPKNFTWEILHKCNTIEELNKYEADYIGLYNTFNDGYNLTYGGHGGVPGWKQSEETKQIIATANKGNNIGNQFAKGYKHTDEALLKISITHKNKTLSEETKLKLSKANKGKNKGNKFAKNKHSTETKRKMSENSGKSKPVMIDNKHFCSIVRAAKFMGVTSKTITDRIEKQCEGYRFI